MSWMNENVGEYSGKGATGSTDTERSSSHKYSGKGATGGADAERSSSHNKRYRSGVPANPPFKQGSAKKSTAHGSSRSASVERTGLTLQPWMNLSAGQALPSQPFVQDPNMPLPTPPNVTVQLEEAKRRLEEKETRTPVKSK